MTEPAQQRRYRRIIPLLPSVSAEDLAVMRWLTRESFEATAAADGLTVVDYAEATVPAGSIPAANKERLTRPIGDYRWHEFTALAERRTDPRPRMCGYCPHPPHEAGTCDHPAPPWLAAEPGPCPCAIATTEETTYA